MNRPFAVTLLAIVAGIAGIIAVIDVLRYLEFAFSPLRFIGAPIFGAILAGIVALVGSSDGMPVLGGINVVVWQNQGEEILNSLRGLRNAGIFGGVLAVSVLFFFLRRIKTTLIVAVAIPFYDKLMPLLGFDLEQRIGEALGRETRAVGANVIGAPCLNLLRHPAWGRAQETYSEDPYHLGEMGVSLTQGVQAHNVMACLKHYAVNNIDG